MTSADVAGLLVLAIPASGVVWLLVEGSRQQEHERSLQRLDMQIRLEQAKVCSHPGSPENAE